MDPNNIDMFLSGDDSKQIDSTLLVGADITSLDNGVVFVVGSNWLDLTASDKKLLTDKLFHNLEIFDYSEICT